jgi:hypothetical protein
VNYPKPEWTGPWQGPEEYLESFLESLADGRSRFDWKLLPDSGAEPDTRSRTRYRLRGICRKGPAAGRTFEPVGAVCYLRNGTIHDEDNWSAAARALGLPSLCVAELVAASNDHTWTGPGGDREPVEHLQALRRRLIEAVGLDRRGGTAGRMRERLAPGRP